jgi:type II secretory pathway pseudopilin PulG
MVIRRSHLIVLIVVLVIAVIGGIWLFRPSDEKQIKKRFRVLTEVVEKKPQESMLTLAAKATKLSSLFTSPCQLSTGSSFLDGTYQPTEVAQVIASLRSRFSDMSLRFTDITIELTEDDTADVLVTARLTGQASGGDRADEYRELRCILKKVDGTWLFSSCEVIRVLDKQ